ncbi:MAG: SH3 domain-containing protein [Candidatus Ventricola sp.]
MKRLALCLLAALLCCCAAAQAEQAYIGGLDHAGRLNLRAAPDKTAQVLGKYYEDVPVDVLGEEDGWAKVSIFGRSGYVMSRYLSRKEQIESDRIGEPAEQIRPQDFAGVGGVPVFEEDSLRTVSFRLQPEDYVRVLGVVSETVLHVLRLNADGSVQTGYAPLIELCMTENFRSCVVTASDSGQRVNLRQSPSMNGVIIGSLYPGCDLQNLFDWHTVGDGWAHVTFGGVVFGYVKEDYLDSSAAGVQAYRMPVAELREERADWYAEMDKTAVRGEISCFSTLTAGGVFGSYVAVQEWDPFGGQHTYGFVRGDALKAVPKASPSTLAVLTRDVPVMTGNGETEPAPWDANHGSPLKKGAQVRIIGEYAAVGMPYLSEQTQWVLVEALLDDGSCAEVVVPMDALQADPLLLLPERMTRG